jgi:hypothetical protein
MFLPTLGANRDRTPEFTSFKSPNSVLTDPSARSDSSQLLERNLVDSSPLAPFFEVYRDARLAMKRVRLSYSELLRAHQTCLRPTFADAHDDLARVTKTASSITSQLADIRRKISMLEVTSPGHPDRAVVIRNLRNALQDTYRQFSTDFRIAQETFSQSYEQRPTAEGVDEAFDMSTVIPREVQQQLAPRVESQSEVERIAQRAEEVREIFAQLADIVAAQGTVVDRIDCNIGTALGNTVAAQGEVEEAAQYQKKSRLWICVMILVFVIAGLLAVALFKPDDTD